MPPSRRSALEVSFPDLVDQVREEEDIEPLTNRGRTAPSQSSIRKESKRKKINSPVDARVSIPLFYGKFQVVTHMRLRMGCRHRSVITQPPTRKILGPLEVHYNDLFVV